MRISIRRNISTYIIISINIPISSRRYISSRTSTTLNMNMIIEFVGTLVFIISFSISITEY